MPPIDMRNTDQRTEKPESPEVSEAQEKVAHEYQCKRESTNNTIPGIPLSFFVRATYARGEVPRKEELPEDAGLMQKAPDQVMVRRRMKTKPIDYDEDVENDNADEYETAMFMRELGLVGSDFYHTTVANTDEEDDDENDEENATPEPQPEPMFYHTDLDDHSDDEEEDEEDEEEEVYPTYQLNEMDRIYEERTILFQSIDNYRKLAAEPHLSQYFDNMRPQRSKESNENGDKKQPSGLDTEFIINDQRFGEQILVEGCDAAQICVGDILEVAEAPNGSKSRLRVQVTSPRKACAYVDKRNNSRYGMKGVRRHCNTYGLAGWFARVLEPGELREGMRWVRVAQPHPKWTLEYVSKALYGEGDRQYSMAYWADWNRSKEELEELCALQEFGWYEWKDEAQWILDRWEMLKEEDKKEPQSKATNDGQPTKLSTNDVQPTKMSKDAFRTVSRNQYLGVAFAAFLLSTLAFSNSFRSQLPKAPAVVLDDLNTVSTNNSNLGYHMLENLSQIELVQLQAECSTPSPIVIPELKFDAMLTATAVGIQQSGVLQ